jgi:hypothetical protein
MKIVIQNWSIEELVDKRKQINPKPQYQRTEVWTTVRKQNLIDSIICGYDLPKFYVRFFDPAKDKFDFEVTDGQQRMTAIWDFVSDVFSLKKFSFYEGRDISGLKFSELPGDIKTHILDFTLTFSEILSGTNDEINTLFARLQQGVTLNPAELRNAIPSEIGLEIKKLVAHPLFKDSRIDDKRFKHQEYLDNIFALAYYHNNKDLKAKAMSELYVELSEKTPETLTEVKALTNKVKDLLNTMQKINALIPGIFKNKWGFVDAFNILLNKPTDKKIDIKVAANELQKFEKLRAKYSGKPSLLLDENNVDFNPEMYSYISSFNKDGALKSNIERRRIVMSKFLSEAFI